MATIAIYFQGEKIADRVIDKTRLTVGRNAENDLVLADNKASGQHARISFEKNQYIIEDLMSTNGTFYRGERVLRHICHNGDELQIGEHLLRFSELDQQPPNTVSGKMRSSVAESLRQQSQEQTMFLEITSSFQSQEKKASGNIALPIVILAVLSVLAGLGTLAYFLLFTN